MEGAAAHARQDGSVVQKLTWEGKLNMQRICGWLFALACIFWGAATYAQNVKITPLGSHTGEFCDRDRATIFEDPTGVRILYDAGQSVTGGDDPRIGSGARRAAQPRARRPHRRPQDVGAQRGHVRQAGDRVGRAAFDHRGNRSGEEFGAHHGRATWAYSSARKSTISAASRPARAREPPVTWWCRCSRRRAWRPCSWAASKLSRLRAPRAAVEITTVHASHASHVPRDPAHGSGEEESRGR